MNWVSKATRNTFDHGERQRGKALTLSSSAQASRAAVLLVSFPGDAPKVALFGKKSVGAPIFGPGLFRFARFARGDLIRGQYEHRIAG